jgi:hypothetical protein
LPASADWPTAAIAIEAGCPAKGNTALERRRLPAASALRRQRLSQL